MLLWCSGTAGAVEPPTWWGNPIKESAGSYYFAASGDSAAGPDEALAEAQSNALEQIALRAGGGSEEIRRYLATRIHGWTLYARDIKKERAGHHAWILLEYSKQDLAALATHLQAPGARLVRAKEAVSDRKFSDALAIANALAAEYPVAKQPVFQTERALLLASDCHAALGQPRLAVQACESVWSASSDPAFRAEAETRRAAILADYTNLLFRGVFGGKRIMIGCVTDLGGHPERWAKMQTEMEALVTRAGGELVPAGAWDLPSTGGLFDGTASAQRTTALREFGADGMVLFRAKGEMVRQATSDTAGVHFSGAATGLVQMTGREPYVWEQRGPGGRTPLGAEMALDILALNVRRIWQADFAKQLEAQ